MINYKSQKLIKNGGKSEYVYLLEKDNGELVIKKKYNLQRSNHSTHFKHEITILKKLKYCPFVPKIIKINSKKGIIYMTYCGKNPQLKKTELSEYKTILSKVMKLLEHKWGIYRVNKQGKKIYEIDSRNVCIKDSNYYLIDFGSPLWKIV